MHDTEKAVDSEMLSTASALVQGVNLLTSTSLSSHKLYSSPSSFTYLLWKLRQSM
jgi:hypothetical protein